MAIVLRALSMIENINFVNFLNNRKLNIFQIMTIIQKKIQQIFCMRYDNYSFFQIAETEKSCCFSAW